MALAITRRRKPKTVGRNPWAPMADRLIYAYNMQDGSGTTLDNSGTRGDLHATNYDAALVNTPTWVTDTAEGPMDSPPANVVRFTESSSQYVQIPTLSTDEEFERFTIMCRFKWAGLASPSTGIEPVFSTGSNTASGNAGALVAQVSNDGTAFVVNFRSEVDDEKYRFDFTFDGDSEEIHTLILTNGEYGFHAWLDGQEPNLYEDGDGSQTVPTYMDGTTAGLGSMIADGDYLLLNNDGAGVPKYSDMDHYAFYMWDIQPEQIDVDKLFADCYIPSRTMADITLLDEICPYTWDVDDAVSLQGAKFVCNTKSGSTSGIRVTYSTDPLVDSSEATGTVSNPANGASGSQVEVSIQGRPKDTVFYALVEQISDASGTDAHLLPIGRIKFKTQPTDGSCFIVHADDHFNIKRVVDTSPDDTTIQGKDIVDGSVYPTRLANWMGIRDMEHRAAGVAGAEIDCIIGLGDDIFTGNSEPNDDEASVSARCIDYRNQNAQLHALGQNIRIGGNHEAEANYHRYKDESTTIHNQKFATINRKKYFPSPSNDVGVASQAEWIAGLTDTDSESTPGVDAYDAVSSTLNGAPVESGGSSTVEDNNG